VLKEGYLRVYLYTSGPTAYGSIQNLHKASGLSITKVKQFLHNSNAYSFVLQEENSHV